MPVIFNTIEYLSVFLLAVEAIKIENINTLVINYLKPFYSLLNPKFKIVSSDEISHSTFLQRQAINLYILAFHFIGLIIIFLTAHKFNIDLIHASTNAEPLLWFPIFVGLLIVPIIIGFLPFQILVWVIYFSIKYLNWIQQKTHTGIVGILGFVLYTIQFIGSKILPGG